jgi:predicted peptidase
MMRIQRFADLPVRIEQREITLDGRSQTYGLLVPKAAPEAAGSPMILGLHYASPTPGLSPYFGLGYVGQLVLPALQELNAILVAPDAPDATWTSAISERLILAVLDEVQKENKIDPKRTLVTGFSMGGAGTWALAAKRPERVRGAIPIAAAPPPSDLKPAVPVYVIHSRADESQPFERTDQAVRALETQGANVTLAALDGVPHRDISQYIEPLAAAIPWIRRIWGASPAV